MTDEPVGEPADPEWDVFISYASEERPWVKEHLFDPLLRCRTADGRRPRVFLDVSDDGITPGADWLESLLRILRHSRHIVPVYSRQYFKKHICIWELRSAATELINHGGSIVPVVYHPDAVDAIPDLVRDLQFVDARVDGWFARLCRGLALQQQATVPQLRFLREPVDVCVSHTFPTLDVEVLGRGSIEEVEITLQASNGALRGTTTLRTEQNVARFTDLSIGDARSGVILTASAEGCALATSAPFSVETPPTVSAEAASLTRIAGGGDLVFFDDGTAFALFTQEPGARHTVLTCSAQGHRLGLVTLDGPPRVLRRRGSCIAVATWDGTVCVLTSDGRNWSWNPATRTGAPTVPGDLAIAGEGADLVVYAGFWTGEVYRLAPLRNAERCLLHEGGIQALGVRGASICVCSLTGEWSRYDGGVLVATQTLEPIVRGMKIGDAAAIVVGERSLFYIPDDNSKPFAQSLKLDRVTQALMEPEHAVAMDAEGRGVIFDRDLFVTHAIHLGAGAAPVCADRHGWYIFRLPAGGHDLVVQGKTIYHHPVGPFAVTPDGELWALGDERGISLVSRDTMKASVRGEQRGRAD